MKCIVIGLGTYGRTLAQDLAENNEVIAVDSNPSLVEHIKDKVASTFVVDTTDEEELALLPLHSVDRIFVAIGQNYGASIRTIALLKKAGVKQIYARAMDEIQKSVLEAFDLAGILTPEEESARNLAREMDLGGRVNAYSLDQTHYIFKIKIPSFYVGRIFSVMKLKEKYGLTPITLLRNQDHRNLMGLRVTESAAFDITENTLIMEGDWIVCYGTNEDYQKFCKDQK